MGPLPPPKWPNHYEIEYAYSSMQMKAVLKKLWKSSENGEVIVFMVFIVFMFIVRGSN